MWHAEGISCNKEIPVRQTIAKKLLAKKLLVKKFPELMTYRITNFKSKDHHMYSKLSTFFPKRSYFSPQFCPSDLYKSLTSKIWADKRCSVLRLLIQSDVIKQSLVRVLLVTEKEELSKREV